MSQATLGRLDWTLSPRARTRIYARQARCTRREREREREAGGKVRARVQRGTHTSELIAHAKC